MSANCELHSHSHDEYENDFHHEEELYGLDDKSKRGSNCENEIEIRPPQSDKMHDDHYDEDYEDYHDDIDIDRECKI